MTNRQSESGFVGVILLQLGGPGSIDEVQPFLESMFRDPDLFDLPIPRWLRTWLARKLSIWRAKQARPLYEAIGGKSPIGDFTRRQAELLQKSLRRSFPCRVFVAMRYGSPSSDMTIESVRRAGCQRLVLLPLYPQFSAATTGSSFKEWNHRCTEQGLALPTRRIDSYYSLPGYIAAVAMRVEEGLARFSVEASPHIVFSAHGLPRKFIRQGDPYQHQIEGDSPASGGALLDQRTAYSLLPKQGRTATVAQSQLDSDALSARKRGYRGRACRAHLICLGPP